jgi:hypothetical protein
MWFGAAALSASVVGAFVWLLRSPQSTRSAAVLGFLPFLLAGLAVVLDRVWARLLQVRVGRPWAARLSSFGAAPAWFAAVPFLILWLFSQFRPVLTVRGLLLLAPFVLLALAAGLVRLWRRRWLAAPVYVLLAGLHVLSIASYRVRLVDPIDFRALAAQLTPLIQPSDLLFLRHGWDTTPILFHLPPSRYRWFADHFCPAVHANPSSRVWELVFYGRANPPELGHCLAHHRARKVMSSGNVDVLLHVPEREPALNKSGP